MLPVPTLKLESVIWYGDDTVPDVVFVPFKTIVSADTNGAEVAVYSIAAEKIMAHRHKVLFDSRSNLQADL